MADLQGHTRGPLTGGSASVLALIDRGGQIDAGTNPDAIVVNPEELGPTGWGPLQSSPYRTAHTSIVTHDYSADAPIGKSIFGHYPHPLLVNPFRNRQVRFRDGMDVSPFTYRSIRPAFHRNAMKVDTRDRRNRKRGSGFPTIEDPLSVPYVETVPPVQITLSHPPLW